MRFTLRKLAILLFGFLFISPMAFAEDDEPTEINYIELKPSIVSNLTGGPKYIRCNIQLMTDKPSAVELVELHTPMIRHHILMLIAGENGTILKTRDGKEALRTKALENIQAQLTEATGKPLVKDLFFTAYYVK